MSLILGDGAAPSSSANNDLIKEANIQTFQKDVLEASLQSLVLVDFWAPWCGPCKQLTPVLEKIVQTYKGKVRLVKINIDQNQALAQQLYIQSVPTVFAFFKGQPVDGFSGALSEPQIKQFIDRLLQQLPLNQESPINALLDQADQALNDQQDFQTAGGLYQQILQHEPGNIRALCGMALCYLHNNQADKAQDLLNRVPADQKNQACFAKVEAALQLAQQTGGLDVRDLEAKAQKDPTNFEVLFDLALAYYHHQKHDQAIDCLITIIQKNREWQEDKARQQLFTFFEALGPSHPETLKGRRKLSTLLFS